MAPLNVLKSYEDDRGNVIKYDGPDIPNVRITFVGSNNTMVVADGAKLEHYIARFDCDNGYLEIGESGGASAFRASIRVGQDSSIVVGRRVTSTGNVIISAVEGTSITIGDDVMFASNNQVRTDDGHPIFDIDSGDRVNVSRSIEIGDHVWVTWGAAVLGGSTVAEGSVIAMSAVVKGEFPNNCIIAGIPARVTRENIAWERPHLSLERPFYKPNADSIRKSRYWRKTGAQADPANSDAKPRGKGLFTRGNKRS